MPPDNPIETEPSLEGLVRWLETQDPMTTHSYTNPEDCLLCRYFRAIGLDVKNLGPTIWFDSAYKKHDVPPLLNDIAHGRLYGTALTRARKLLKDRTDAEHS